MPDEQQNRGLKTAINALENLRKRLLDLTGRNRLINFRHTKRGSLRIIDELPDQLVETLLAETEMRFLPVPEPTQAELIAAGYIEIDNMTGQEIRLEKDPTAEEWGKRLGLATSYEVPKQSQEADGRHADTAIQMLLYPYELEARLKSLMQTAESAIQEMGANILYLAFGFLEWFETNNDSARIAPLFLVPVRLHKGRLNPLTRTYEYTVSYSGEDIIPNLSLREKLRADFALALPDLDENTVPEAYFEEVLELIKENQPRWRVRRFITLTLLNFSKLLMYLDLDPSNWPDGESIIDHSVVTRFLSGYNNEEEEGTNGDLGFGEEYLIDDMEDIHTNYPLIDDADSSQHSALIDAVDGKNLVIEGPPGTGKSQTITNLIAAAMAQGKRVLFVAEKLAALEVVRHRLDLASLGEFCLELHSHKTQKRKVLDEIEVRLKKRGKYRKPRDIEVDIVRYEELKTALKGHVDRINRPWKKTGKTLHEIFMAATRYREAIGVNPDDLHPEGYDGENFDVVAQRRTEDQVEAFRKVYQAVAGQLDSGAELQNHPWYGVRNADLQMFDIERVSEALENWQRSLQNINGVRTVLADGLSCEQHQIADSINNLSLLLEELDRIPSLNGNELLDQLPTLRGKVIDEAKQYLHLFEEIQALYASLERQIGAEILHDLSVVDDYLSGNDRLQQLVGQTVELGALAEAINRLTAIHDLLTELEEPLTEIHAAVGQDAASHLLPTKNGLIEFRVFTELVADLNPSYWKCRDELFDNDEMDELLPNLREDLGKLQELFDELNGVFHLDDLPTQDELQLLKKTIETGGAFRWFKGDWRNAKKQVLNYAASKQIRFSALQHLLDKAAEYSGHRYKLDNNQRYKDVFGDHLKGLDTDLMLLEELNRPGFSGDPVV
ncbi:MAG: DUF4011 domain-containing protein [Pseudomonadota bacterium]